MWSQYVADNFGLHWVYVLIVEGLGPLLAPRGWRQMVAQLSQQPDNQLRRIGGCLVVAGAVIAYVFAR
ncbi:membrane protein [Vibrio metoecus]|uniref:Membrane protein n=1 Tax=Vibrio metoecus TaxID=1481663 RepID=A0A0N8UHE9_VIBMT|nr:membrane protein [Vibrio metoecus]